MDYLFILSFLAGLYSVFLSLRRIYKKIDCVENWLLLTSGLFMTLISLGVILIMYNLV